MLAWPQRPKHVWCLPDVGATGEDSVPQRLWCHPAYWEQSLRAFAVVVRRIDIARHSKIYKTDDSHETHVTDCDNHQLVTNSSKFYLLLNQFGKLDMVRST